MIDHLLGMGLCSVHIDMHLDYLDIVWLLRYILQVDRVLELGHKRVALDLLAVFEAEHGDRVRL